MSATTTTTASASETKQSADASKSSDASSSATNPPKTTSTATESKSQVEFTQSELKAAREKAAKLGYKTLEDFYAYHDSCNAQASAEVKRLLEEIGKLSEGEDLEKHRKSLSEFVDEQITIMQTFAAELAKKSKKEATDSWADDLSIPVSSNKILECLHGAKIVLRSLLNRDGDFYAFCEGNIPDYLDIASKRIVISGEKQDGLGNSKGSFLKTIVLLLYVYFKRHKNENKENSDVNLSCIESVLKRANAIVYPYLLPKKLSLQQVKDLNKSCFVYEHGTKLYLLIPHSFYGFGAGRTADFREMLSPMDCSSLLARFLGLSVTPTTEQQYQAAFRSVRAQWEQLQSSTQAKLTTQAATSSAASSVVAKWPYNTGEDNTFGVSAEFKALKDMPVVTEVDVHGTISTQLHKCEPGQVYVKRRFNLTDDPHRFGKGATGHTGFTASDVRTDGNFAVAGCNRDMPTVQKLQEMLAVGTENVNQMLRLLNEAPGKEGIAVLPYEFQPTDSRAVVFDPRRK